MAWLPRIAHVDLSMMRLLLMLSEPDMIIMIISCAWDAPNGPLLGPNFSTQWKMYQGLVPVQKVLSSFGVGGQHIGADGSPPRQ